MTYLPPCFIARFGRVDMRKLYRDYDNLTDKSPVHRRNAILIQLTDIYLYIMTTELWMTLDDSNQINESMKNWCAYRSWAGNTEPEIRRRLHASPHAPTIMCDRLRLNPWLIMRDTCFDNLAKSEAEQVAIFSDMCNLVYKHSNYTPWCVKYVLEDAACYFVNSAGIFMTSTGFHLGVVHCVSPTRVRIEWDPTFDRTPIERVNTKNKMFDDIRGLRNFMRAPPHNITPSQYNYYMSIYAIMTDTQWYSHIPDYHTKTFHLFACKEVGPCTNPNIRIEDRDTLAHVLIYGAKPRCACGSMKSLKLCTRCNYRAYCSAACQKADWPQHKEFCRLNKGRAPDDYIIYGKPESVLDY
jgi:hypothetical protein